MRRKWVAIGIILFIVGAGIIPAGAQKVEKSLLSSRGNWLYAGGIGSGNYTKIQDAINNASAGDTVFVYDDSSPYHEHIIIEKSILLIGENKDTTVIDGEKTGNVVYVNANHVTIRGFSIQNSGNSTWEEQAGIFINGTNNDSITGNIIMNNVVGMYCDYSEYQIISENIISHNWFGLFFDNSLHNTVDENVIEENIILGIFIGSTILPSQRTGFSLSQDVPSNEVVRNTIEENGYGILMWVASFTRISENTIAKNDYGLYLCPPFLCSCDGNTISQNSINNNTIGIFAGDDLGTIVGNNITRNNILDNTQGITFTVYDDGYWHTKIARNKISKNNFIGNTNPVTYEYSFSNQWSGNYWGDARVLPYPLIGKIWIFKHCYPWLAFDLRPAQEPIDIPGARGQVITTPFYQ